LRRRFGRLAAATNATQLTMVRATKFAAPQLDYIGKITPKLRAWTDLNGWWLKRVHGNRCGVIGVLGAEARESVRSG
jgi:hypothetical protein